MRNAASKVMWAGRAKNALTFALAIVTTLAMGLLVLALAPRSAEAAFPGTNGKIVFSSDRDGDYEIYAMNANGTGLTQLTNNAANDREPTFSADGTRIAFSRGDFIWLMDADGSNQVPVRIGSGPASSSLSGSEPTFSPDGSEIAFTNKGDIYVVSADGGSSPKNLTNDAPANSSPAWSPDGNKIALVTMINSLDTDIFVTNSDGSGAPIKLVGGAEAEFAPTWSPDGTKIAYMGPDFRRGSSAKSIYEMPSEGGGARELFGPVNGGDHAFSPDGSKMAFELNNNIVVGRADSNGTSTNLTPNEDMDRDPDWGPLSHDLSLMQSDSPDPVKVNNNLTYTLKVKNEGFDAAPGVVLTDKLPSGVTFVSASTACTRYSGKVTCKLGTVAKGATVTKTITVTPTAQGTITNTASVKSSAQEVTYTHDNSDRERTQVTLNRAPVANDNSYVTKEDTPLTISAPGVLSNDTDADSDQLTVANVVETTSGGTLTHNANGSFTYTPNNNFNGADAFTYTATDGTAQSNVATVAIVVRAVNDAPNAQDDSAQTEMNTPLDINVLSNDRDAERDEISITEVSDPANGTATLNTDGTVRYAPDTDYLGFPGYHYLGPDSFTYTVSDGNGATDTATVNIQVTDTKTPDAPVITSPANNTTDTDGSFTILGTAESYTSVEILDGGQDLGMGAAVFNAEGTWFFELSNVSEGSHSYTVKVIDRGGNTSAASEPLTVIVDKP